MDVMDILSYGLHKKPNLAQRQILPRISPDEGNLNL